MTTLIAWYIGVALVVAVWCAVEAVIEYDEPLHRTAPAILITCVCWPLWIVGLLSLLTYGAIEYAFRYAYRAARSSLGEER